MKIKTSYKIAVNPEESKSIQEICFRNGITWAYLEDNISHIDSKYLYIDVNDMLIRQGSYYKLFKINNKEEISAEDFIKKYDLNTDEGTGVSNVSIKNGITSPKNRIICKTVHKQSVHEFNDEMQKIYDNYLNHDIDVKYSTHQHSNCTHFSAFVTITPKQIKENLRIG